MKYYKNTTQVPNSLFDIHLKNMTEKELKVILIVIRQTLGWIDRKGKRKERDWISRNYFMIKTGLSSKSVSCAINLLVKKKLLECLTAKGDALKTPQDRRGKNYIHYKCSEKFLKNLLRQG